MNRKSQFGRRGILICVILFFSQAGYSQESSEIKVLFLGNSYTYFFNLPQTVSLMAEAQGADLVTRQSTAGGATWQEHWEGAKSLKSREIISEGNWDYVVLQNHSMSAFNRGEEFMDYGKRFADRVRSWAHIVCHLGQGV